MSDDGHKMMLDYRAELEAETAWKKKEQMPAMIESEFDRVNSSLAEIERASVDSSEYLSRIADEVRELRLHQIHKPTPAPSFPLTLMPILYAIAAMLAYALFIR